MTAEHGGSDRRLRVDHEGGDRFSIAVRHHTLRVDQPVSDGGEDSAPTQIELFMASLASCVAFSIRRFLFRHGEPTGGLAVTADFEFAEHPARVGEVHLRVEVAGTLSPERRAALLKVASHCTVHNTLVQPPKVGIELAAPVATVA